MKKTISIFLAMAMVLSPSLSVLAATGNVAVDGHIGTVGDPGSYDMTYTTAVHWWVTQASPTAVVDGDSSGPNAAVVNKIENNNTATEIKVSLVSFDPVAGDATNATLQGYLTLNLTGALANNGVGSINLSTGYTGPTNYTNLLAGGAANAWTFGFGGTYAAPTLTTSYAPAYTMALGFEFAP